jgi:hypothetical protein
MKIRIHIKYTSNKKEQHPERYGKGRLVFAEKLQRGNVFVCTVLEKLMGRHSRRALQKGVPILTQTKSLSIMFYLEQLLQESNGKDALYWCDLMSILKRSYFIYCGPPKNAHLS